MIINQGERKPGPQYTDREHRKVLRAARQLDQPQVVYQTMRGTRNGFLISDDGKQMIVRLVGDLVNRRISRKQRHHVSIVTPAIIAEHKQTAAAARRAAELCRVCLTDHRDERDREACRVKVLYRPGDAEYLVAVDWLKGRGV